MASCRLSIIASHFIQYNSPIFQILAKDSRIELIVYYLDDQGITHKMDNEFREVIKWDRPLDEGYRWNYIGTVKTNINPIRRFINGLSLISLPWRKKSDVYLFLVDYSKLSVIIFLYSCLILNIPVLYRGDTTLLHERGDRKKIKRIILGPCFRKNIWGLYVGVLAKKYIHDLGVAEERLIFSPHSVDSEFWSARAQELDMKKKLLRRKFDLPESIPVVIFCGKIIDVKSPLDLALSMCRLAERMPVSLLVVGSGPLKDKMKAIVQNCEKLYSCFTGFLNQNELPLAYGAADVISLPSSSETWGLVVNEAMYFGCVPVVSSMVGCAPDLVDGIGEVHQVGNVDELTDNIQVVINELHERRSRIPSRIKKYSSKNTSGGIIEATLRSLGIWQEPE